MHEIADLIFRMYLSTNPSVDEPEEFDCLSKQFISGLSEGQAALFYELETMYYEMMDRKLIALLEFLINLYR